MVDWDLPIEAVHKDGRVVPAKFNGKTDGDYHMVFVASVEDWIDGYHGPDGLSILPSDKWLIRNTATTPPFPAQIAERMRAVVDIVARRLNDSDTVEEARAIMAELVPVDADLLEARRMASEMFPTVATTNFIDGKADEGCAVQWLTAGIKRGRELERDNHP